MSDLMAAVRAIMQQNPELAAAALGQGNGVIPYSLPTPTNPRAPAPLATGPQRFGLSPEDMAQWGVNMPQQPQPLAPLADPAIAEALERSRNANAATRPAPSASPSQMDSRPAGVSPEMMSALLPGHLTGSHRRAIEQMILNNADPRRIRERMQGMR